MLRATSLIIGIFIMLASTASAQPKTSAFDFSFPAIDGGTVDLGAYRGKVVMIVNTASACGFTPQYDGLQALYERFSEQGFVVIGVPSNDFGRQETGTAEEIKTFCEVNFNITFPMADKVIVKGDDAHPFYQWAKTQTGFSGRPRWNFHKYLIGKDGQIADWFATTTAPDNEKIIKAIASIL